MTAQKEKHRAILEGYFYACCPFCRLTLLQGRNATDCFVKCPQCGQYTHVIIKDDTDKPKEL